MFSENNFMLQTEEYLIYCKRVLIISNPLMYSKRDDSIFISFWRSRIINFLLLEIREKCRQH